MAFHLVAMVDGDAHTWHAPEPMFSFGGFVSLAQESKRMKDIDIFDLFLEEE